MTEQEKCCATCATDDICPQRGAGTCGYTVMQYPHWTPKPAPEAALPTLAGLDKWIATVERGTARNSWEMAILRYVRPLLEVEECKRGIAAAGCGWSTSSTHWGHDDCKGILLRDKQTGEEASCATWPDALRWAREQKAKREEALWSKPIRDMSQADAVRVFELLWPDNEWVKAQLSTAFLTEVAIGYLRGYADASGRRASSTDSIWLGPLPMPNDAPPPPKGFITDPFSGVSG